MQIDVIHGGGKGRRVFLKSGKFNVRRDGGLRRQVNPRVTRLKIVRLCLYNQEKSTEPINHNNPSLGATCTLKILLYIRLFLLSYSCNVICASSPTCSRPHLRLQGL